MHLNCLIQFYGDLILNILKPFSIKHFRHHTCKYGIIYTNIILTHGIMHDFNLT